MKSLMPIVTVLSLPILLWPSAVMIIAIMRQAQGASFLRPKHLAIFAGVQIVWLLLALFLGRTLLRPFGL